MKSFLRFSLILMIASAGWALARPAAFAHPAAADFPARFAAQAPAASPPAEEAAGSSASGSDDYGDYEEVEEPPGEISANQPQEETFAVADPLEPVNRVMYQFNDKLYFWALKPVAQGYKLLVPEPARISVKNFFSNLAFPARFVSCLLQADISGAATEAGRFAVNTIWGIGGLLDPAAQNKLNLQMQDTDLGQTLGVWGVGHGFYIVWPVFGPSSPRDTVTLIGDYFLYPVSYLSPWYAGVGVRAFQEINATSLRIGDYEALKSAAIDPYVAFRDAYLQYRFKKIKARRAKISSQFTPASWPVESAPTKQG
ncbi:MAG TPA: VacJ family lipoprotein, partial [Smithella sp.]|nr:VacJ family lipoprotein [Smithella sp.]